MIRFLTAGESHGPELTGIIDGIPAGLLLLREMIDRQLARRQLGYGRGERMKIEHDVVAITSGVRYGVTTGAPIALTICNRDWENWSDKLAIAPVDQPEPPITMPRPGHADAPGLFKYHHQDIRNVIERASARETAMRVAMGAIARELLAHFSIAIGSHVIRIGNVHTKPVSLDDAAKLNEQADASPVRCLDSDYAKLMMAEIDAAKAASDTLGGEFEVVVSGLPVGLGSYVQADRRLDGILGGAILSIPAIKAVSIGSISESETLRGSGFHDRIHPFEVDRINRSSNRSGGIEGGMTTGEALIIRATMKPLASLMQPLESVDFATHTAARALRERSDVCAVPAAAVVAEHVIALALVNVLMEKVGGDSLAEMKVHFDSWGKRWDTYTSQA